MAKTNGKRTLLDDLIDGARDIMDSLDRLINPGKRPRPVPVPIPVRQNPPRPEPRRRY
ncbi:MAG: hypothetical protein IPK52_24010 [Chloroflexi bacterium]|nr:hypothetical protein [Chloroflexota bacterium]